jgi:hypothetical protein
VSCLPTDLSLSQYLKTVKLKAKKELAIIGTVALFIKLFESFRFSENNSDTKLIYFFLVSEAKVKKW